MVSVHPNEEVSALLEHVAEALGPRVRREVPIGPLTTYRVGGAAALFTEPESDADLQAIAGAVAGTGVSLLVLGKGSDMLVADRGWPGLCVRLGEGLASIELEGTEVVAGGAAAYPVLARRTASAGLTGMEWAVGVPGSVGGAVRMNAGGHGAETRDRLIRCRIVDLASGSDRWLDVSELDLSYRHSCVGEAQVVVGARFGLETGDAQASLSRISEIVRWRREAQPGGQNAGSVFTNPPGDSAGRLIDSAGLKGFRIGTASVSTKHANFIQADDGGSADDVARVVEAVRQAVADRTGVELAVELQMIGFPAQPRVTERGAPRGGQAADD
jgi:UDP-N-acetylmuramate dehydrogenase